MENSGSHSWFSYFQVELFIFIFVFSFAIEDVTVTQLAQDKICMQRLNSSKLCANLSTVDSSWNNDVLVMIKDRVLVDVTTFNFYQSMIYTIPLIFTSLFLSAWADRHRNSTKILLCLTTFMFALESMVSLVNAVFFTLDVNLMLIAFIFFPMVGGSQVVSMAVISYLTATTEPSERVAKFTIFEIINIIANPLGVFVGGLLIQSDNPTKFAGQNGQLHNYHHVLFIATVCKLIAFFYALLFKFKPRKVVDKVEPTKLIVNIEAVKVNTSEKKSEIVPLLSKHSKRTGKFHRFARGFSDIFVFRNIVESFEVCVRKRNDRSHIHIWLLLVAMTFVTMTKRSMWVLMFQFVQKLYNWDAGTFSTWNSILYVTTHLFGLLVVTPLLTKVAKVSNTILLLVGLVSLFGQDLIRGIIINVYVFCSSYLFGSIASVISVAVRAKLSKLVAVTEQNRIFGVLAMLETISPLFGIALYTKIFNSTITTNPGFVFQLTCILLLVPFGITLYILFKPIRAPYTELVVTTDCKMVATVISSKDLNNNSTTGHSASDLI